MLGIRIKYLMLCEEVIEVIKESKFHIYKERAIAEGITILICLKDYNKIN